MSEAKVFEDVVCWGVWRDGGALDVLDVAVGATVVSDSSLQEDRKKHQTLAVSA